MIDAGDPGPDRADITLGAPAQADDKAALTSKLMPLLRDADRGGFTMAAIHIDAAIVDLGGVATPPVEA